MKFKDKLLNIKPEEPFYIGLSDNQADQVISLSKEFTIEFINWLTLNCTLCLRLWTYTKDKSKLYTMEELISIFEKESGI